MHESMWCLKTRDAKKHYDDFKKRISLHVRSLRYAFAYGRCGSVHTEYVQTSFENLPEKLMG